MCIGELTTDYLVWDVGDLNIKYQMSGVESLTERWCPALLMRISGHGGCAGWTS